jgi:hypothetical protein
MELGNAIFGHSRGEFHIERGHGWEEELIRLFESYSPRRDNSWREYGEEFVNSIFEVHPYWWGECTCGAECPIHAKGCDIVTKWGDWVSARINACSGKPDKHGFAEVRFGMFANWEKKNPAPKCTCGAENNWVEKEEHESSCKLVAPNFWYKPSDFQIQWYKYPLRDSYKNQNINLSDFRKIIDDCIKSLGPQCGGPRG